MVLWESERENVYVLLLFALEMKERDTGAQLYTQINVVYKESTFECRESEPFD